MYHATATVATILMTLGEMTKKLQQQSGESPNSSIIKEAIREAIDDPPPAESSSSSSPNKSECAAADDSSSKWCITFEQLLASLLTDNLLVQYFDQKYDLNKKLIEYKSKHA